MMISFANFDSWLTSEEEDSDLRTGRQTGAKAERGRSVQADRRKEVRADRRRHGEAERGKGGEAERWKEVATDAK